MSWRLGQPFLWVLGAALLAASVGCGDDGSAATESSSESDSATESPSSTSAGTGDPTATATATATSGSSATEGATSTGSSNATSTDPTGGTTPGSTTDDTAGATCGENEFVQSSACVPCPAGTTNEPGDDPAGPDTMCMDACEAALGVPCDTIDEAYVKASNTGEYDVFGYSVTLSGDTLAVGAPNEASNAIGVNGNQADNSAPYSGAVYVFRRSGSTWAQEAYLKASNTGAGFGNSVALDGDTLAVGATGEASNATGVNGNQTDESASGSGAVYVFRRSGSAWAQEAYIKASNTEEYDHFGRSVALDSDTLAVAATGEDSNATGVNGDQADNYAENAGAVYVFRRSGSSWAQEAYLKASNTGAGDRFGHSVALSGDTLAVGATGEDSNATGVNGNQADNYAENAGVTYVFRRSGSTWAQEAYLKASNTGTSDDFGYAVALSGDTLVVGAPREASDATGVNGNQADTAAIDSGAVYVFRRSGSTWAQEAYVKASNTGFGDQFGVSVALDGDTLAVGAWHESSSATGVNGNQADDSAPKSGAVYLFRRAGSTWAHEAYLKASNPDGVDGCGRPYACRPGDNFGTSVTLDGTTLAVGASGESSSAAGVNGDQADNSAPNSGAVYVRRIAP